EGRHQPERQQQATTECARAGRKRRSTPGTHTERLHETARAVETVAAEQAEQLLGAVAHQEGSDPHVDQEKSEFHYVSFKGNFSPTVAVTLVATAIIVLALVATASTSRYTHLMTEPLPKHHIEIWRAFLDAHALALGAVERDLAAAGMPPPSWYDVLWSLARAPEGRMRIHAVADAVLLSRSGLSRLLDRMESEGLITRAACPSDRRGAYAVITGDGKAALRRMWPVYERS